MANEIATVSTDAVRDAAEKNLDYFGDRRRQIEEAIRSTEATWAESLKEMLKQHHDGLAAALAPLEADLRDTTIAIYAQERTVGALPPVQPRFSERSEGDHVLAEIPETPQGSVTETVVN